MRLAFAPSHVLPAKPCTVPPFLPPSLWTWPPWWLTRGVEELRRSSVPCQATIATQMDSHHPVQGPRHRRLQALHSANACTVPLSLPPRRPAPSHPLSADPCTVSPPLPPRLPRSLLTWPPWWWTRGVEELRRTSVPVGQATIATHMESHHPVQGPMHMRMPAAPHPLVSDQSAQPHLVTLPCP